MRTDLRVPAAVAVLVLALAGAAAVPSTSARLTATITDTTTTAASAVFTSDESCGQATADAPTFFTYPLDEPDGATQARDLSGNDRPGTFVNTAGIRYGVDGPVPCPRDGGRGVTLDGTQGFLQGAVADPAPQTFSVQLWFRTTTTVGGKLAGLGNGTGTDPSSQYDRHVYLTDAGELVFGVRDDRVRAVTTPGVHNDGVWHQVVATLSATPGETLGMRLYVDGKLRASDTSVTSAEPYAGAWRFGFDSVDGWPSAPRSQYFAGSIAWPSVVSTALTATQVRALYLAGRPR